MMNPVHRKAYQLLPLFFILTVVIIALSSWSPSSAQIPVVTKFTSWPPSPGMMWSAADSPSNFQPGAQILLATVPADRWLVITEATVAPSGAVYADQTIIKQVVGGSTELKIALPFMGSSSDSNRSHSLSHSHGLGIAFPPGSQVILENYHSQPILGFTYQLVGYFVQT